MTQATPISRGTRVLLVNNLYTPHVQGGAELSVQYLAEALAREGLLPSILTVGDGNPEETVNGVAVHRVTDRRVRFRHALLARPSRTLQYLQTLVQPSMVEAFEACVRGIAPDIIHTNNLGAFTTAIWTKAKALKIPVVHTLRDFSLICRGPLFRDGKPCTNRCMGCSIPTSIHKWRSIHVDAVVGNSRNTLEHHVRFGYFRNARIRESIWNIVPNPPSKPRDYTSTDLRIGFLGRFAPEKGLDLLIEAFNRLPDRFRLVLAGRIPEEWVLSRISPSARSRVDLLGYVPAEDALQSMDLVVVPSLWHEPLARTILEGMSYGLCVIASSLGGSPELIQSGQNGFLFDPDGGGEALASLISGLDVERVSRIGTEAHSFSRNFRAEEISSRYIAIYRRLLDGA